MSAKWAPHSSLSCSLPLSVPISVGPLRVEFSEPVNLDMVHKENQQLMMGGRYRPNDCVALQKVALILPFRNRDEHLKYWLYYLHPILQRQQLDYGIYVIEQVQHSQTIYLYSDDRSRVEKRYVVLRYTNLLTNQYIHIPMSWNQHLISPHKPQYRSTHR